MNCRSIWHKISKTNKIEEAASEEAASPSDAKEIAGEEELLKKYRLNLPLQFNCIRSHNTLPVIIGLNALNWKHGMK